MELIQQEYESKNKEKEQYLNDLSQIVLNSNTLLEGNCFYYHQTLQLFNNLYTKQLNLYLCGKLATSNICEIGFNAGHSTMLLLLGRDKTPLNFTVFDIGVHAYTRPSLEYIKSKFLHVNFEYIEGDSTITMPEWINTNQTLCGKYDVVHVDGGHSEHCISNDMKNADILVKINGILIVDDTNDETINNYVNLYISNGNYIEVHILQTYGYKHRVIKKVK
jgi:hypothetical protein